MAEVLRVNTAVTVTRTSQTITITRTELSLGGGLGGGPPSGPAGGVLAGTYPNPGFAADPDFAGDVTLTDGSVVLPAVANEGIRIDGQPGLPVFYVVDEGGGVFSLWWSPSDALTAYAGFYAATEAFEMNATQVSIGSAGVITLNATGGVTFSGRTLRNVATPSAGTHVGDRDYNDARYPLSSTLTETVQDIAGGMVTGNTETGVTVTYDDINGKLDFAFAADMATQAELDAEAALARNADNLTSGTVADARIASTIARDSEVTSAISTHEADTTSVHGITDTTALYRSGGTDVAIADGGTGASTAATAFSNLKQDASETATGVVELATAAEVLTGTDTTRAATAAGISAAYLKKTRVPGSLADDTWDGPTATLTAAENLVIGDVCYINSSSKMAKGDADASGTAGVMAIALATINTDASGLFGVVGGFLRDDSAYAFTPGQTLYLSTTPGGITATAPSGTGDQVQVLGYAYSADVIWFAPSPVLVAVA